jgi:rhodanese-related sulfurtransferase
MIKPVDPTRLKAWLHDGDELALLDVREHGLFGEGHLFYAVPLPYSRFELEISRLVPRRTVRLVLCDDGRSGVAEKAARRATGLGYTDIYVLAGGTEAWVDEGYRLFAGVNVPSKAFGELIEHAAHVPVLSARELDERRAAGEPLLVLDGRPADEHRKMNIPGSICCPNGELVYRLGTLVRDAATPIVIHCAGRTRSIIGAQTLRDFGIANPIYALENGTMGWSLAGLKLEHGSTRVATASPSDAELHRVAQRAQEFAARHSVPRVSPETLRNWLAQRDRTTYLLDVRTVAEFEKQRLAGVLHAPGGQLIQATDQWLGTRNARVVLVDDLEIRAVVTARWLRRLGWEAHVLAGGVSAWGEAGETASGMAAYAAALPNVVELSAAALREQPGHALLDLRPSGAFQSWHVRGARWANRSALDRVVRELGRHERAVIISEEDGPARAVAVDLTEAAVSVVGWVRADRAAFERAGIPVESTPDQPPRSERIDHLFFVHDRHDGNLDAAREYIAWETGLVAQLDEPELRTFDLSEFQPATEP